MLPSLRNAGFSFARVLHRGIWPVVLVLVEFCRTLARGNFDGCDFRGELASSLSRGKALLRAFGPTVLLFAGDLVRACEVFSVPSRMLAGEGVVEAVHQHRIEDLGVAHTIAPAPGPHEIGGAVHVLHAAGNRAVDEPEHDLLSRASNRLRTRAADAVDRQGRNIDRDAAMDGRLPGRVHFIAGLDYVAHDDRADIARWQFRALKRRTDYYRAKIDRWHILQRAAVCADGSAHGGTDDNFFIGHGLSPRFQSVARRCASPRPHMKFHPSRGGTIV